MQRLFMPAGPWPWPSCLQRWLARSPDIHDLILCFHFLSHDMTVLLFYSSSVTASGCRRSEIQTLHVPSERLYQCAQAISPGLFFGFLRSEERLVECSRAKPDKLK